jgi:amidase
VLVFPTSPLIAPKRDVGPEEVQHVRERTIGVTSISGFSGAPEVTLPAARVDGAPVGLSLLSAPGTDRALLALAERAAEVLGLP